MNGLNNGEYQLPNRVGSGALLSEPAPSPDWFQHERRYTERPFRHAKTRHAIRSNSGFDILRGPGLATVNAALSRNFALREKMHLMTRVEAGNMLNRTNFALPGRTLELESSGVISHTATPATNIQFVAETGMVDEDKLLLLLATVPAVFCTGGHPRPPDFDRPVSWKLMVPNLASDQKRIWTSPSYLNKRKYLVPALAFLGATAALIALDPHAAPTFRDTTDLNGFNKVFSGNNAAYGTIAVPAIMYATSFAIRDTKMRNTALHWP